MRQETAARAVKNNRQTNKTVTIKDNAMMFIINKK